ncbi:MAG: TIGR04283 family arsenosugar biosynthesis glycosyltransferase [Pseudomonadota bacterium]
MPAPLSIIIPSLNAQKDLPVCLEALMAGLEAGLIREVILVDGGSTDQTRAIADAAGAVILDSSCGRGCQLKAGGEAARGDWLLFLHADTVLTPDWVERALAHMQNSPAKAAAFTLAFRSDARRARWLAGRANWRAHTLGLPYGDQGLLISRELYDEIGGYEDIPLMEDVSIIRRVGKKRLSILSAEARTSGEKYERDGWRRRAWRNVFLVVRYFLGADPAKLAIAYDRERPNRR